MTLIDCQDCKSKISNHADSCPKCGNKKIMTICDECRNLISKDAEICPKCGIRKNKTTKINKFIKNNDTTIVWMKYYSLIIGILTFFTSFAPPPWDEDSVFGLISLSGSSIFFGFVSIARNTKGRIMCSIGISLSVISIFLLLDLII